MTDPNNNRTNRVLVAIDIAKKSHDALIEWPNGKRKMLKVSNTLDGFNRIA